MGTRRKPGNRQPELFARSTKPVIEIAENHRLVQITEEIDWTELEELVQAVRLSKLKSAAGRPTHLRALIGALVFRALRYRTIRDLEDLIRYYAPARFLCGLTESKWSPDANTIQDFEQLIGEEGVRLINERVVAWAVEEKLADPRLAVADTTAPLLAAGRAVLDGQEIVVGRRCPGPARDEDVVLCIDKVYSVYCACICYYY